jgi:HAD superfamily hydrolase (TIGR01484 family)
MGRHQLYVFISDLDNTLFESGTLNLRPEDKRAIEHWKENGNEFWVATGRTSQTFQRLESLGIAPDVLIFSAGAGYMGRDKKIIYRGTIEKETTWKLLHLIETEFPRMNYFLDQTDRTKRFGGGTREWRQRRRNSSFPLESAEAFLSSGTGELLRVFCTAPDEAYLSSLAVRIAQAFQGRLLCIHTDKCCADILPCSCTKWLAVKEVLEKYHLSPEACAAVGDDEADEEMIIRCGFGFAVRNAVPQVLESADRVVNSVSEAIAYMNGVLAQKKNLKGARTEPLCYGHLQHQGFFEKR